MESVRIWSFSGPYSIQMRENTNQKNSKYEHFLRSYWFILINQNVLIYDWFNFYGIKFLTDEKLVELNFLKLV